MKNTVNLNKNVFKRDDFVFHLLEKDPNNFTMESEDSRLFSQFSKLGIANCDGDSARPSDYCAGFESPHLNSTPEIANDLLLFVGDEDGDTPLHLSVIQKNDAKSAQLIGRAPDYVFLNIQNDLCQTPAHLAAITDSGTVLRRLMCAGSDLGSQDKEGNTPLHIACAYGHEDCVRRLLTPIHYTETLENRYDIPFTRIPQNLYVKNYEGLTCLHLAVMRGNMVIVQMLLQTGDDHVTIGDSKSGRTALHIAAEQGRLDVVALLLTQTRYLVVDTPNYEGYTPIQLAHSRGHADVVRLLFAKGASDMFQFEDGLEDLRIASTSIEFD